MNDFHLDDDAPPSIPPANPTHAGVDVSVTVHSMDPGVVFRAVVDRIAEVALAGANYRRTNLVNLVSIRVTEGVEQRLADVLQAGVSAIVTKAIQKHDAFGEPCGPGTTLETIIDSAGAAFLHEIVDEKLRPISGAFGNRGKPRVQWMIEGVVMAGLEKALKDEAAKLRVELEARARTAVADMLAKVRIA